MYKGQSQETLQTKPTNKWKHKSNTIIDHKHRTLTHIVTCHTVHLTDLALLVAISVLGSLNPSQRTVLENHRKLLPGSLQHLGDSGSKINKLICQYTDTGTWHLN